MDIQQKQKRSYDLLAGAAVQTEKHLVSSPLILVFDSGMGGLTVFAELLKLPLGARFIYAADNAGFPYGRLTEKALQRRVSHVLGRLIERYQPDIAVIACNTVSTLAMPVLRDNFTIPFIATVPAIKPAVALSKTKCFSVLATPGTVSREYTKELIDEYAHDCSVTLVGAKNLAVLAEAVLHGETVSDEAILTEIAPSFVEINGQRTDVVVLACTHYPLLLEQFKRLSPWPVTFLDPAPAIARRVLSVVEEGGGEALTDNQLNKAPHSALFTSKKGLDSHIRDVFSQWNLPYCEVFDIPFEVDANA